MKVTWEVDEAQNLVRVVAEFNTHEIASLNLDHLDRALLREPHEEPADILLKAEMLARRLQHRATQETEVRRDSILYETPTPGDKSEGLVSPKCQHDLQRPDHTIAIDTNGCVTATCTVCKGRWQQIDLANPPRAARDKSEIPVATASRVGDGMDPGFYRRDGELIFKE